MAAAWFVLTVPTAAYEQKLLADRDRNANDKKVLLPPTQVEGFKGFLSLAPVQGSTLLQNRCLETGLSPFVTPPESIGMYTYVGLSWVYDTYYLLLLLLLFITSAGPDTWNLSIKAFWNIFEIFLFSSFNNCIIGQQLLDEPSQSNYSSIASVKKLKSLK